MCLICGDDFETLSWGGPTMPCACGAMVSQADAREMDPQDLADMREGWAQADEPAAEDA